MQLFYTKMQPQLATSVTHRRKRAKGEPDYSLHIRARLHLFSPVQALTFSGVRELTGDLLDLSRTTDHARMSA